MVPDVIATLAAIPVAEGDRLRVTMVLGGTAGGRAIGPFTMAYTSSTGDPDELMVSLLWSVFRRRLDAGSEI